jgi:hypothetical protein
MEQKKAQRKLVLLIGMMAATTAGLHHLGRATGLAIDWSDPIGWLNGADPEVALAASLRSVGLAVGYWISVTTLLYVVFTRSGRDTAPRLVRIVTLPGIRRIVDRGLATALAASIAISPFSPALALEAPEPPPIVFDINRDGVPVPHIRPDAVHIEDDAEESPEPSGATESLPDVPAIPGTSDGGTSLLPAVSVAVGSVQAATPTASAPALSARLLDTTYTVARGDNLWSIADRHLQETQGTAPSTAAIASYWKEVIATNTSTLRSGDPNLIYPGELIQLPEVHT